MPGVRTKRRIRTRLEHVGGNVFIVRRNRSVKPLPANWRELLGAAVTATCEHPPEGFFGSRRSATDRSIETPHMEIPLDSTPDLMVFVLSTNKPQASYQRRALAWSLTSCDVHTWPVPKVTHRTKDGEVHVLTDLPLHDTSPRSLFREAFHTFNSARIGTKFFDIDGDHLAQYAVRTDNGEYLGIKTTCGGACKCQSNLEKYWPLGWEMHY